MTVAELTTILSGFDGADIPDKINKWVMSMVSVSGATIEINSNFLYKPIYVKDHTGKPVLDNDNKPIVAAKFGSQGHVLHCVELVDGVLHFVPADDTYTERWFVDQYVPVSSLTRVFVFANQKSQYRIDYENKVKQEREASGFSSKPHKPFRADFGANAVAAERSYPTPNKMSYPEE
jgi:hypothetical protein